MIERLMSKLCLRPVGLSASGPCGLLLLRRCSASSIVDATPPGALWHIMKYTQRCMCALGIHFNAAWGGNTAERLFWLPFEMIFADLTRDIAILPTYLTGT